jgi:hypothetical protein
MISLLSRYATVDQATLVLPDGREIRYLRRRFVPHPELLATSDEYVVRLGDRLDRIAATTLGDPELFWRIADGNRATRPAKLVEEPGRRLRITLPEGIPGGAVADRFTLGC